MIKLHERILPDPVGIEPATSWSHVGHAPNQATKAGWKISGCSYIHSLCTQGPSCQPPKLMDLTVKDIVLTSSLALCSLLFKCTNPRTVGQAEIKNLGLLLTGLNWLLTFTLSKSTAYKKNWYFIYWYSTLLPHCGLRFFKITGKTCGKIYIHLYYGYT